MVLVEIVEKVSYGSNVWRVVCDCGKGSNKKVSDFWKLKSCSYTCPTHIYKGKTYPPNTRKIQLAWHDIKARCLDSTHPSYPLYGGRGIDIYEPWVDDFNSFFTEVGQPPTSRHSIDRIDNSKGYVPGNLRWATRKEQANNTRKTIYLTIGEVTKPLAIWASEYGKEYDCVYWRYTHGWKPEDIIR